MAVSLRICSLLPSATEIVFALGLGDRLVAITHECDYPSEATHLPVITRSTLDHGTHHSREIISTSRAPSMPGAASTPPIMRSWNDSTRL